MPIADFERRILRLLAANRNPESFVAGATVLLRDEYSPRTSQDVDLFHDTAESLRAAAISDCDALRKNGYAVTLEMQEETFCRGIVEMESRATKLEWAFDSAFRFFPVEPDPEMGYVLNFWDAATNKVLALAGRGELRDYLDVLYLDEYYLSLGALVWAACGKDAGYTPQFLVEEAQRLAHYPLGALEKLNLRKPLDLVSCKQRWLASVQQAHDLFNQLPSEELGCLYLDLHNRPVTPRVSSDEFSRLRRHFGTERGAWPGLMQ